MQCFLSQKAAGTCAIDSVTSYNLHDDPESTPYGIGYRQQHGVQVRGGSENVKYFLHGEWEDEDGVTKVPDFESRILAARRSRTPSQESPTISQDHRPPTRHRAHTKRTLRLTRDISQDLRLHMSDAPERLASRPTCTSARFQVQHHCRRDTLYFWRQFTPRDITAEAQASSA